MTVIATIHQPGLQTTVQDRGRGGWRHLGVPQSGAADRLSLALANVAVGNPWDAPALECAMTGPALTFEMDIDFAVAGADMGAALNDAPVSPYERAHAKPGDKLTLGSAKTGARAYIAFAGGVAGEKFLNSMSTYLPASLGGLNGRALRSGDVIENRGAARCATVEIPKGFRARFGCDWILRATEGPDSDRFDPKTARLLFSAPFTANARGDRMGVRLNGEAILPENAATMKSGAVFPGTVQCPNDGSPFLLGPDAQTVGGYPRVAQAIEADLPVMGQIRPGDRVWFRRTTPEKARETTAQRQKLIASFIPNFSFL